MLQCGVGEGNAEALAPAAVVHHDVGLAADRLSELLDLRVLADRCVAALVDTQVAEPRTRQARLHNLRHQASGLRSAADSPLRGPGSASRGLSVVVPHANNQDRPCGHEDDDRRGEGPDS